MRRTRMASSRDLSSLLLWFSPGFVLVAIALSGLFFVDEFTPVFLSSQSRFESLSISDASFVDALEEVLTDHREWNVKLGSHVYVWRSLNRTPSRTSKITMKALSRAELLDPGFNSEDYIRSENAFPSLQGLRSAVTVTNDAETSSH